MKTKPFRFSPEQNLAAYKLTKALYGMVYINENYEPWYINKMEKLIKSEESI